ncbi:hypothetical protein C8J57DRAFT_199076 [Mycena rebaudengoi]|nr:hypothetical protein C8J57DRAFT_199076 [Mycena rebaudengoi]
MSHGSRLYSRLLLPEGHGYPLFHPQPFDDLSEEARRIGTEIGDVGVVTSDGSFDVIFNICRAADDPINRLEFLRVLSRSVWSQATWHPGHHTTALDRMYPTQKLASGDWM